MYHYARWWKRIWCLLRRNPTDGSTCTFQFYVVIMIKTYSYNSITAQLVNPNACYPGPLATSSIMLKRKYNEKLMDWHRSRKNLNEMATYCVLEQISMPLKQVRISSKALSFFEIIRIKHDETSKKRFQDEQKKVGFRKKIACYTALEEGEVKSMKTVIHQPMIAWLWTSQKANDLSWAHL